MFIPLRMPNILLALPVVGLLAGCSSLDACPSATCLNDQKISAEVEHQFDERAEFLPGTIRVQTYDGVVYLYGFVDTQYEKTLATSVAKVKGVKSVRNELREWPL